MDEEADCAYLCGQGSKATTGVDPPTSALLLGQVLLCFRRGAAAAAAVRLLLLQHGSTHFCMTTLEGESQHLPENRFHNTWCCSLSFLIFKRFICDGHQYRLCLYRCQHIRGREDNVSYATAVPTEAATVPDTRDM